MYTFMFKSACCLDVQKHPGVYYNGDEIMIMTSREMTHFTSDMQVFIVCATMFLSGEFHRSVCGDDFWLCYGWGEVNRANTLLFSFQFGIN